MDSGRCIRRMEPCSHMESAQPSDHTATRTTNTCVVSLDHRDTLTRGWLTVSPSYLLNPYIVFPSLALSTSSFDNAFTLFAISSACRGTIISPNYSTPWLMLYRKFSGCPIRTCTPHTQLAFLRPTLLPNLRPTTVVPNIIPSQAQSFYAVESRPAVWHSFWDAARHSWITLDIHCGRH
jgi:hypothetical protein